MNLQLVYSTAIKSVGRAPGGRDYLINSKLLKHPGLTLARTSISAAVGLKGNEQL